MEKVVTISNVGVTYLANEINIKDCEVAVTRFILPLRYYNVKESKVIFKHGEANLTKTFPAGYYPNLEAIVTTFEYLISKDEKVVLFDNDEESQRLTISVGNSRSSIVLSPYLAQLLHLPTRIRGTVTSTSPVRLMEQRFYLQADFVTHTLVNGGSKQLLYVAHDESYSEYVKQPVYIPVCKDALSSLTISLTNDKNENVKFLCGSPLVQLTFRKKA